MTCRIRAGEVARPLTRLHPKGCSARSWRDRSGDPSCLGPPLLPIHSCRPVIRAAAGLGVRPDRPAAVAGSCRQSGILAHGCPKNPTEPGVCVVTHHSPVRVDTLVRGVSRRPEPPGPAWNVLIPPPKCARCATGGARKKESRLLQTAVRRLVRFELGPDAHGADASVRPAAGASTAGSGGSVTRAVRRSPSSTRSARASVGGVQFASRPVVHQASASRSAAALPPGLGGAQSAVGVPVVGRIDPAEQVDHVEVTVDHSASARVRAGNGGSSGDHRGSPPAWRGRRPCGWGRSASTRPYPGPPGRSRNLSRSMSALTCSGAAPGVPDEHLLQAAPAAQLVGLDGQITRLSLDRLGQGRLVDHHPRARQRDRLPGVPAASSTAAGNRPGPGSGLHVAGDEPDRVVEGRHRAERPPGSCMKSWMSRSGSWCSRYMNWAITSFAEMSSIGPRGRRCVLQQLRVRVLPSCARTRALVELST